MPFITTNDGTEIYYKDWGSNTGPVVVFSHGWPLNSDSWDAQMFFMANNGCRVIAHDRRGHGRSSQPWEGNDMNTYADDLMVLFEKLNLRDVMLVGHSTGGGEITRFVGRHGTSRVSKAVLVGAVTPLMLQTESNPEGTAMSVFDSFRAAMQTDRAQFFIDVPTGPFFGFNKSNEKSSQGLIWSWWQQGMTCGFKNAYDCIAAFSETDFRQDLANMNIPVLILHGDDDQVVPIKASAYQAIDLLPQGKLKVYHGGSHALPNVNADEVNADLLKFLKE